MGSTLYTWFKSRSGPTPPQAPSSTEKVSTPDLADVDIEKGFPQAKVDRQTRR